MEPHYDLIIIGSGTAGLSAGLYAGRYRMKTLVIGAEFGGETASAGTIENYPGVKTLDGYELEKLIKEQAVALGVEVKAGRVEEIRRDEGEHCFVAAAGTDAYRGNTLIFATGAERRKLGLPNEDNLRGRGVHYCVTCDGPVYAGKTIALVGGGDASVKGANLAAEYVEKVYLIVRGKEVTAEPINLEQFKKLGDKVEVLLENEVKEIVGTDKLQKLVLAQSYNGSTELAVDGLFVEVGAVPNVELPKSLGVELDDHGYIKVDSLMKTNVDGVFAAGDAVNHFGPFKQDITAAALGAVAATSAYSDHKVHGELCLLHAVPAGVAGHM
ncbi:MAG: FAD-dependent oxidoreductase [Patescibacteria group bacterium]|nr:FAD-dependent oxidoreductase [Patescibacteria group bacterium]